MKVDIGFWDKDGYYIEQLEELTKEEIKEIMKGSEMGIISERFELLQENERLKKEIWQLQHRKMWNKEATLQAELLIKENERLKEENLQLQTIDMEIDRNNNYRKALEEIREILFPKNKWIITDCEEILEIQKITNEVLK